MNNKKYHSIRTVPKSKWKILCRNRGYHLTHVYMTTHFTFKICHKYFYIILLYITVGLIPSYISPVYVDKCMLNFKCLRDKTPYLTDHLCYISENNPYHLRNAVHGRLNIPKPITELHFVFKKSFRYSGSNLWNKLLNSIRSYFPYGG